MTAYLKIMVDRKATGHLGEVLALAYLEHRGYQLVSRNYRHQHGEIDLIMVKEEILVFVEVKTRKGRRFGYPEEHLSPRQVYKIKETAEAYLALFPWGKQIRFDIISVILDEFESVRHFRDAY